MMSSNFYRKWLRFYLDFCQKHGHAPKNSDSLPHFINKLKNQVKQVSYKTDNFDENHHWKTVYAKLSDDIKDRHYSGKTLKAYNTWMRQFQHYVKGKQPELLGHSDVRTTMIYTHTVRSRMIKDSRSPLDF